mgnify:CR=1 FL=1
MTENKSELEANLQNLKERVEQALALLAQGNIEAAQELADKLGVDSAGALLKPATKPTEVPEGSRVIEGVFDGQHMVGADGKQYLVPPNYASKSKLVEGDLLKLSITPQGAFIYKQIGPCGRKRVICALDRDEAGMWSAGDGIQHWKLLTAAVSYFHGQAGDEAVILIPSDAPSKWAAVENIIAR